MRERGGEAIEGLGAHAGSGGVVRIAHEDHPRPLADGGRHGGQVVDQVHVQGYRDRFRTHPLHDDRVHGKGRPGEDRLVTGPEEALGDQLEDLVGAGTEDELVRLDSQPPGEGLAQTEARPVGIAVHALRRGSDRLDRLRRRSQRILVRGELDRALNPELALELLDRLARLVRLELGDVRLHESLERHA